MTSPYDDVWPFVVTVLAPDHLLADELRALLVPGQPRDLYNIWLPLRHGWSLTGRWSHASWLSTIDNRQWEPEALEEAVENLRADWAPVLRPLLAACCALRGGTGGSGDLLN